MLPRRWITAIVATVTLLGLLAAGGFPGGAAQPAGTPTSARGFVGAWLVTPTVGGETATALTTFNADGTILTSNRPVQPAPPVLPAPVLVQSLGHGSWVATGERTADVTFVFLQTDVAGTPLGTRTVRGSLELDAGNDTWTGTFSATVADPDGAVLQTSEGTVAARRITAASVPAASTPAATPVGFAEGTPTAAGEVVVAVDGLVERPLRLTAADLRGMRSRAVEVAWTTEAGRPERSIFRGVPLQLILEMAGPRLGLVRDAEVGSYVVVTGRDGYQAVVAWGEIAPRLAERPVILAWEQNGQPLTTERQPAQLVVPGDQRDERAVWGVVRIELRSAADAPAVTPTS